MVLPVAAADAVLDQGVGGGGVGNAQQRLGEAEQRDAFGGAEAVFLQEVGDVGARLVGGAGGTDQAAGSGLHGGGLVRRQRGGVDQRRQNVWFRGAMQATQGSAVVVRHVGGSWGRRGGSSTALLLRVIAIAPPIRGERAWTCGLPRARLSAQAIDPVSASG